VLRRLGVEVIATVPIGGESQIWLAGRKGSAGETRSEAEMGPAATKEPT
jgi:hypothetical protein